jgi:hypothetical protein
MGITIDFFQRRCKVPWLSIHPVTPIPQDDTPRRTPVTLHKADSG